MRWEEHEGGESKTEGEIRFLSGFYFIDDYNITAASMRPNYTHTYSPWADSKKLSCHTDV
jgi:hypothetical protein